MRKNTVKMTFILESVQILGATTTMWDRMKDYFELVQGISSYKQQNHNSKFSQNLLECHHSIGTIQEIMEVVQVVNKETITNVSEKFCICEGTTAINSTINLP